MGAYYWKKLATLDHQGKVIAIAFSADGKTIATASDNKTYLWEPTTGKKLATLKHKRTVNAVTFSPDSQTIATASDDKTARIWDVDTHKELATFYHQNLVRAVAFSPDSQTIATANFDRTARLHSVTPEALVQQACRHLSRNLTAEEWQQYINSDLETYQKTCENLPVHPSVNL